MNSSIDFNALSIMEVSKFIHLLTTIKESSNKVILFVGFDGTQSILKHSPVEFFINDICKRPITDLTKIRLNNEWSNLLPFERRKMLFKHTSLSLHADNKAIKSLAFLLENHYINAILATDPNQTFYNELKEYYPNIERIDCVGIRISKFEKIWDIFDSKQPLFFDGADILLGLNPSFSILEKKEYNDMLDAMKRKFNTYCHLIYFGWNKYFNLSFPYLWDPQEDYRLYQLGDYSDTYFFNSPKFQNFEIIGDSQDENITNDIIIQIGEELEKKHPKSKATTTIALKGKRANLQSEETKYIVYQPSLLWNEKIWRNQAEESLKYPIVIIGVEGRHTLSRITINTLNSIKESGREVLFIQQAELFDVSLFVESVSTSQEQCLVVEFDYSKINDFVSDVSYINLYINEWLQTLRKNNKTLLIFMPSEFSASLEKSIQIDPSNFRIISLFARHCINENNIKRCITSHIEQIPISESLKDVSIDNVIENITKELHKNVKSFNGEELDKLQHLIDILFQLIWQDIQSKKDFKDSNIADICLEQFNKLSDSYLKVKIEDFTIEPKPKKVDTIDDASYDFKLGVIKKKNGK